jgi:hypothetical protein
MASTITRRLAPALLLGFACCGASAQQSDGQVVSFRCALALDAVIAELDKQTNNPVTRQALERSGEENGEFVCIQGDQRTIIVRLQSPDMGPTEGRLVFSVDARTYKVLKTYFGP